MDYMGKALSLAKLALGQVSPNPAVGAVVVKNGVVVGEGYTRPPGSAHAEIVALEQAGDAARGATLFVTLEPCCHFGRTPPCTGSVIAAGISRVHMAMLDPNPLVAGKGKEELEKAGIKVTVGEHEKEAREITEAYLKFITTGMPFVTVKFAVSLDGRIATRSGDSKWISGAESRKRVHYLRYISDAVMTGANTVLADDPYLTVRCGGVGGTMHKQPLRVIVDGRGRAPLNARLFKQPGKTLVAITGVTDREKAAGFRQLGAELLEIPSRDGIVDLRKLLKVLGEKQVTSVMVEGGGILLGYLFDLGLVDKVIAFVAPVIIGGSGAKPAICGTGAEKMADALRLRDVQIERFGNDVMVSGYVQRDSEK
ncbi:MAG: bifunctional diaminohydroxyphosphoribosylaminopyrimidine deaminase/5-amino-6-(5-phosphoribosylamino)uracil reductase RibD [Chloroflexi bacterium]|nr:bifunctional diaminohydroxyphosphoribosylaminopyrimidine deaminase/5-amino-6-(5-phosphoribosylamino)uracil reductase RibD [Chloroflexota bacterium]